MEFASKDFKTSKTKKYIRTTRLFFFFTGVNRNSNDWVLTEQKLKTLKFNYYKIFNKTSAKTLKNSIYSHVKPTINGITFFIKPSKKIAQLSKPVLINKLSPSLFFMLAIKLNHRIYPITKLKDALSLDYNENKLLLYQFGITNLKPYFKSSV